MRSFFALGLLAGVQVVLSQLTNVQRENILSVHNALRAEVLPQAADMHELVRRHAPLRQSLLLPLLLLLPISC